MTIEKLYETAFEQYRETTKMKLDSDGGSTDSSESPAQGELDQKIASTLGLLQRAHDAAMATGATDKIDELRYFLTWMYYHAGHLAESAVMGESVARWGDKDDSATKEALMVALAATQEASATQWGIAEQVGEVDRMRRIVDLVARRWPKHPQLETFRFNLAQTYDSFGKARQAAKQYDQIDESSERFANAQLAAGNALWYHFRGELSQQDNNEKITPSQVAMLQAARKHLVAAKNVMQRGLKTPTSELMNTQLTLTRIDLLTGKPKEAIKWLTAKPFPLNDSVVVDKPKRNQVKMSPAMIRGVFEAMFAARSQLGDSAGAKTALQQMSKVMGAESGGAVGDKMLGVAVDFASQMTSGKRVDANQVKTFDELLAPLQAKGGKLTHENRLWIGDTWDKVASRATTPQLAKRCFGKAADAFKDAIAMKGFPKRSLTSARLRQTNMLRQAGQLQQALMVIESILKTTPNVFQLQIEAASAIEQIAIGAAEPQGLLDATNGPADSPIWGWSKLVVSIHSVRFSANGTDEHARQLLGCQEHLIRCRWLLGQATVDSTEQTRTLSSASKMLNRLLQTTPSEQQPQYGRLQNMSAWFESVPGV